MKNLLPTHVLGRRVWTPGRIDQLAGELITSLTIVSRLIESRGIKPRRSAGRTVWGQYLDEDHHSDQQWGFYGTCAAMQVLAALMHRAQVEDVYVEAPLDEAIALPDNTHPLGELFRDKRASEDKNDFQNVIKLGAIAEALHLNHPADVPVELTPPLVHDLMDVTSGHPYWSTRPEPQEHRKDRDFATAYLVLALRRYRAFRTSELWGRSRSWLAQRINDDDGFCRQTTLLALTGLALSTEPEERQSDVLRALDKCERTLLEWAHSQRSIILNRPVFNGFSLGRRNDYIFLHPEILCALFFLQRRSVNIGLQFALDVLEAIQVNIDRHRGFMGHDAMIASVDQLWAARLITRFLEAQKTRGSESLVPHAGNIFRWHTRRGKLFWISGSVGVLGIGAIFALGVIAAAFTIAAALLGMFIDHVRQRR